ncbi:hypothetical protein [Coxiella burnetii]|nr:hypothetical protein [Coxiella burnetii]
MAIEAADHRTTKEKSFYLISLSSTNLLQFEEKLEAQLKQGSVQDRKKMELRLQDSFGKERVLRDISHSYTAIFKKAGEWHCLIFSSGANKYSLGPNRSIARTHANKNLLTAALYEGIEDELHDFFLKPTPDNSIAILNQQEKYSNIRTFNALDASFDFEHFKKRFSTLAHTIAVSYDELRVLCCLQSSTISFSELALLRRLLPRLSTDINVRFYQNLKNQLPEVTKLIDDQWLSEASVQTDKTYELKSKLLSPADQINLIKAWASEKKQRIEALFVSNSESLIAYDNEKIIVNSPIAYGSYEDAYESLFQQFQTNEAEEKQAANEISCSEIDEEINSFYSEDKAEENCENETLMAPSDSNLALLKRLQQFLSEHRYNLQKGDKGSFWLATRYLENPNAVRLSITCVMYAFMKVDKVMQREGSITDENITMMPAELAHFFKKDPKFQLLKRQFERFNQSLEAVLNYLNEQSREDYILFDEIKRVGHLDLQTQMGNTGNAVNQEPVISVSLRALATALEAKGNPILLKIKNSQEDEQKWQSLDEDEEKIDSDEDFFEPEEKSDSGSIKKIADKIREADAAQLITFYKLLKLNEDQAKPKRCVGNESLPGFFRHSSSLGETKNEKSSLAKRVIDLLREASEFTSNLAP